MIETFLFMEIILLIGATLMVLSVVSVWVFELLKLKNLVFVRRISTALDKAYSSSKVVTKFTFCVLYLVYCWLYLLGGWAPCLVYDIYKFINK